MVLSLDTSFRNEFWQTLQDNCRAQVSGWLVRCFHTIPGRFQDAVQNNSEMRPRRFQARSDTCRWFQDASKTPPKTIPRCFQDASKRFAQVVLQDITSLRCLRCGICIFLFEVPCGWQLCTSSRHMPHHGLHHGIHAHEVPSGGNSKQHGVLVFSSLYDIYAQTLNSPLIRHFTSAYSFYSCGDVSRAPPLCIPQVLL